MLERWTSAGADELLNVYLNDHRAGAQAASALARRSRVANQGTEFGDFLEEFVAELDEDVDALDRLMECCDARRNRMKTMVARAGATFGRLKLNGRLTGYSPLSRVLEFEALTAGVVGKQQRWETIGALPRAHPAHVSVDTARLVERAAAQVRDLSAHAQRASELAFAGAAAHSDRR